MVHARVVRQPNRGATIDAIDEKAIKRAAKGTIDFVRHGNFLAIVGDDETAVDLAGAAAVNAVTWQNVETPTATQQEANWLLQRPCDRPRVRRAGCGRAARPPALRGDLYARLSRACLDLAVLRAGGISRRPSDGVDALPGRVIRCARRWRRRSASRPPPSPCTTCRARAATATTAPTMPPPTPPSSPCRCRASRSACAGGARKNSSTSRRPRR